MCVIRFGFDLGLVFFENQDKNTSKQANKQKKKLPMGSSGMKQGP